MDCNSAAIILVKAAHVSLDLGGNMLDGLAGTCAVGVSIVADHVRVFNGAVQDCGDGVIVGGHRDTIEKVTIPVGSSYAIDVTQTGDVVRDCQITSGVVGIYSNLGGTTITGNAVSNETQAGIQQGGNVREVITRNTIAHNVEGIVAGPATITRNTIVGNSDYGIFGGSGGRITRNHIIGNEAGGISVNSAMIAHNVISQNHGVGVLARGGGSSPPRITGNVISGNATRGIDATSPVVITRNMTRGNGLSGIVVSNVGPITDTTIAQNNSSQNDGDGIFLASLVGSPVTTKVFRNTTNGNSLKGIEITGPTAPVGARTNRAKGNASTPQCDLGMCR